jgi:heme/copper-type cytochrome/quinol oxidase subunit 2
MSVDSIIFLTTLVITLVLAGALLYVWWKYGKEEKGVALARVVYLTGLLLLFGYMLLI